MNGRGLDRAGGAQQLIEAVTHGQLDSLYHVVDARYLTTHALQCARRDGQANTPRLYVDGQLVARSDGPLDHLAAQAWRARSSANPL